MSAQRRMSPADAAWIGLDRPEHLMVVTAVLRLATRIEQADLERLVTQRLLPAYPGFRQRPEPSRVPLVRPTWVDDESFDLAAHVRSADIDLTVAGGDVEQALMAYVGGLMGTPLDLRHSPWTLTLVQVGGRSAVVARLHHCLADGIALAGVLLSLVDGHPGAAAAPPGTGAGMSSRSAHSAGGSARSAVSSLATVLGAAVRTVSEIVVGRKDRQSRLRGAASVGRRAAWTSPLDLALSKAAAKRLGVSVNDVLLAAVAGGLRRWLLDHDEPADDCRVMVPVDLRRGEPVGADLGNRFGIVFVTLPVALPGAEERVAAVHVATTEAKGSSVAAASYGLLSLVGLMPRWGQGLAANLLGRIATGIVTNVPGPRTELSVEGAPLTSVAFWVPHIGPIGIGFSVFSYSGTVTVGVATNESLHIDPRELVDAVETELAELNTLRDLVAD
ncbi:MAG: wax ester/triacylglycerol synthase family O-acyltransferase [Actinomycetales bacterium]